MIHYRLVCGADHEFEGWFRDAAAFERQASHGQVSCPTCGDKTIRKGVMAPSIARGRTGAGPAPAPADLPPPAATAEQMRAAVSMQFARKLREHVEKHFDNVGHRFAEEARRMHYGDSEKRDIWGQATASEAQELRDEGIPVSRLPDLPKVDA
jgi:hypothetical protein